MLQNVDVEAESTNNGSAFHRAGALDRQTEAAGADKTEATFVVGAAAKCPSGTACGYVQVRIKWLLLHSHSKTKGPSHRLPSEHAGIRDPKPIFLASFVMTVFVYHNARLRQ
jgi:hypothetical protein